LNRLKDALLAAQNSSQATLTFESEVKHEAVYVSETVYADEGPGSIVAKAKTITGASPLVEINLDWIDTSDHPGWSLNWIHHPDYLLDFLPDYLRQFCPVAEEMIEALQELGLENFPRDYEAVEPELTESLIREEEPIGEYIGGEIRDCRITVKWLEDNADYHREDPNEGHFVHLCIEVWAVDGTDEDADHWSCDFFHFLGHIRGILTPYLKRYCPFPDRVWETAATVPLPEELKGLFDGEVPPYANN
jgi:hypothetical protein